MRVSHKAHIIKWLRSDVSKESDYNKLILIYHAPFIYLKTVKLNTNSFSFIETLTKVRRKLLKLCAQNKNKNNRLQLKGKITLSKTTKSKQKAVALSETEVIKIKVIAAIHNNNNNVKNERKRKKCYKNKT